MSPATHLPSLQHLGLGFNPIHSLPSAAELQACTSLLCLDLSQCDLEDLKHTLCTLTALPSLQSLFLQGNPLCLHPAYRAAICQAPWQAKLVLLDGQASQSKQY